MRIRVNGIPAPQGSKQRFPNGGMRESSRAVGPWREAVRAEAQRACGQPGHAPLPAPGQPTMIVLQFFLPRPRSAPKSVVLPAKRPDLDKLVRAVLDGVVAGGALADDAQVTWLQAEKSFADDENPAGCSIEIVERG
jgi:crossover junction endodeoxyribonuclease RusA